MALAFSLLAALLAILIQQWVREYMHVFQQYGDPLKSSRLRQYLYEGCEGWYMPMVAEAVPGFLHVSLFLFFIGLGDSLLKINTKVALSTIVPISISGLLYIFMIFAPIIYPQSPYQNSFSGIFWYLFQKSCGRKFKDRGSNGKTKSVSSNMVQGQMQLAMEETVARKGRDVRAIRWLIDNLTEDAEMEKFLSAIPSSFNTDWGTEVWKTVGKQHESEDQSLDEPVARPHGDTMVHQHSSSRRIRNILRPIINLVRKPASDPPTHATTLSPIPHPPNVHAHSIIMHIQGENVLHELSKRVARSVEICRSGKSFANNDGLWRKRARACIEATASLVCSANAKLTWFGGISELLGDIGSFEKIRELSVAGTDQLFVMHWTCLSLVAIRPILADSWEVWHGAMRAIAWGAEEDDTGNNDALAAAQKINKTLEKASDCLKQLYQALCKTEDLTEVKEILGGHESEISELEQINSEAGNRLADKWVDLGIYFTQNAIDRESHQIASQIPGVLDDLDKAPCTFSHAVELSCNPLKLQLIRPWQILRSMCSPAATLRHILEGQGDADAYKELLENLRSLCERELGDLFRVSGWQGDEMQRQLCRLQDLRDEGGLGFTVELFFLALSQLLSASSSKESHSALYTGTFRAISSDWSKHKDSVVTQNYLLNIAWTRRWAFITRYPTYISDEFLLLLGNIFEGQTGPHIDKTRKRFKYFDCAGSDRCRFRERMLMVLARPQAQSLAS